MLTSSSSAVGTVMVAALNTGSYNRAINILGVIGADVSSPTTAVRYLSGHDDDFMDEVLSLRCEELW
jgi:hypothetical protein